jgi:GNAT superfamily N-acetyltransferase
VGKYRNYQYEIIWIVNALGLQVNAELVDAFFELYEHPSNFPDPDEREDPHFIKERISEESDDPHTHLMLYVLIDEEGSKSFVGGSVVEFYPDSACTLITYIFVDQAWRGVGIGSENRKVAETLIQSEEGLRGLVKFFAKHYDKPVNAVFFESNNPAETPPENDSIPPAKRLKFFDRMGARRVNFDYIQPPLGDDKGVVTNLFLLTFPDFTNLGTSIAANVVLRFVMELAKSLDRNKEPGSLSMYGQENYRHDMAQLQDNFHESPEVPELVGLVVDGRNIIRQTYKNLKSQKVTKEDVGLVSCLV